MLQMQLRLLIATVDNNLTLLPTLLQVLSFAVSYLDILSRHQTYIVYLKKIQFIATVSSFSIYYRTDGTEGATELNNSGFCLNFQELAI